MSSRSSAPTLELALTPSLRAIQWLLALHVGAISLTFAASPPKWAGLLLAALFLISWLRLRRHPAFGYGPTALTRLSALGDGSWRIQIAEGQSIEAKLLGGSVVWPTLLVLGFRGEDQRTRHRVIVGDEIDPDSLRRLRARLLNPPTSD
jgi:hypothetical protein